MGYTLHAPGTRRNNRTWVVRGSVNGRAFETRTDATTEADAERFALAWIAELRREGPGAAVTTFADAARHWNDWRRPRPHDYRNLKAIAAWFGATPIGDIVSANLIACAAALRPHGAPATRNREIITIASAVLHYAADQGWCHWRRFRRLKVPTLSPRQPATDATMRALLANTEGPQHLLLCCLYETGMRISDSLRMTDADLDLPGGVAQIRSNKTQERGAIALSPELVALLANTPRQPDGRVFPWRDRHGVYRWLRRLCRRLSVEYTPHMSRHQLATDLRRSGLDLREIAARGLWRDSDSVARYTHSRPVTPADGRLGKLRGKSL